MSPSPKSPVLFRLICVRHGETNGNKEYRIQGHMDCPLNDLGKEQARRAGKALSHYKFNRAYCSDLQRTELTARFILENSSMESPPPLVVDPRLKEQNFGWMENMVYADVMKELKKQNISSLADYKFDDGVAEPRSAVINRVVNFFTTLCQSVYDKNRNSACEEASSVELPAMADSTANGEHVQAEELTRENIREEDICETILVVSHGAALRFLYKHMSNNLKCIFPSTLEVYPRNTGFSSFLVRYSPRNYAVLCEEYNTAAHIDDISL
ncbi:fructose-2,6-bisphosphatase TIGAR B [Hyalella azteca]|uniref:Fructose-2,6-bisphosphatase TIGAR B n=1 Tax=Hyalella azteca TaxID=294128 RepID=A0A8B7NMR9_HYAAZ|nr:fructose-2,6-bisphosphatase TIGAR B [Hyalella azteca]